MSDYLEDFDPKGFRFEQPGPRAGQDRIVDRAGREGVADHVDVEATPTERPLQLVDRRV